MGARAARVMEAASIAVAAVLLIALLAAGVAKAWVAKRQNAAKLELAQIAVELVPEEYWPRERVAPGVPRSVTEAVLEQAKERMSEGARGWLPKYGTFAIFGSSSGPKKAATIGISYHGPDRSIEVLVERECVHEAQ